MANDTEIRVIDHEFACFGPIAYDIGTLLAHLVISYFACDGREQDPVRRESFQSWALGAVEATWEAFRAKFIGLWETAMAGDAYSCLLFGGEEERAALGATRDEFMRQLLADAAQFCAVEILRRIIGYASVSDFTTVRDESVRAACELPSIVFARKVLTDGYHGRGIAAFTDLVKRARRDSVGSFEERSHHAQGERT
jgi:5-methylthioribose kinase